MTAWVVIAQDAFGAWAATTDDDADAFTRIAVLEWLVALHDSGPPEDAAWDAAQETWLTRIPGTDVLARYIVFTGAYPPAIVFRRFFR